MNHIRKKLQLYSWALYDFANTIFSVNIISLYFALWITVDMGAQEIFYSTALSISIIISAAFEPFLGAVSDTIKRRLPFLIFFTIFCVLFTALIAKAANIVSGLIFFIFANIGYQIAGMFYNSLLAYVSKDSNIGRISGLGVGLGYAGTIVGMWFVKPFVNSGGRITAFVPTAFLFLLFSIPCFLFVKEKPSPASPQWGKSIRTVGQTIRHFKEYPDLFKFLVSAFWALNAVNTIIIFMAVYAHKVIGLTDSELILFLSVSAIFAILGSFISGIISDRFGCKRVMMWVYILWCFCFAVALISFRKEVFWLAGPLSGVALSSTWVVSRALILKLAPAEKVGEVFGLFGLSGKSSSVVGPVIFGGIIFLLKPYGVLIGYRTAIGVLILFMLLGMFFLSKLSREIR